MREKPRPQSSYGRLHAGKNARNIQERRAGPALGDRRPGCQGHVRQGKVESSGYLQNSGSAWQQRQSCLQVRPSEVMEEHVISATQPMSPPGPAVITQSPRRERTQRGMPNILAINQHGRVVSLQLRIPLWKTESEMLVNQLRDRREKSSLGMRAARQTHPPCRSLGHGIEPSSFRRAIYMAMPAGKRRCVPALAGGVLEALGDRLSKRCTQTKRVCNACLQSARQVS